MYVYGKNVATEILKKDDKIEKIYLLKDFNDEFIKSAIQKKQICTKYLTKKELDKLANGNHQGIIVSVPDYQYSKLEELLVNETPFLILLDHLELWFGVRRNVILIKKAQKEDLEKILELQYLAYRSEAKLFGNMDIPPLKQTIEELKKKGFWIVGTDMEGTDFEKIDYRGKIAIIIGNEGSGMSRLVKESCDFIASIPMYGKINSLNASVAAGVMIYEAIKQRK